MLFSAPALKPFRSSLCRNVIPCIALYDSSADLISGFVESSRRYSLSLSFG